MHLQFVGCGDAFGSGGRFNTCFHLVGREYQRADRLRRDFAGRHEQACDQPQRHQHHLHLAFSRRSCRRPAVFPPRSELRAQARAPADRSPDRPASNRAMPTSWRAPFPARGRWNCFSADTSGTGDRPAQRHRPCAGDAVSRRARRSRRACLGFRFEAEGKVIAFSGDTEWTDALIDIGREADLFICEAYTRDKPITTHMALSSLEQHLGQIRPKRLILTHMSNDMLARRAELPFETAEDGMIVEM